MTGYPRNCNSPGSPLARPGLDRVLRRPAREEGEQLGGPIRTTQTTHWSSRSCLERTQAVRQASVKVGPASRSKAQPRVVEPGDPEQRLEHGVGAVQVGDAEADHRAKRLRGLECGLQNAGRPGGERAHQAAEAEDTIERQHAEHGGAGSQIEPSGDMIGMCDDAGLAVRRQLRRGRGARCREHVHQIMRHPFEATA